MADANQEVVSAVKLLMQDDEPALFEALGLRAQALARDPAVAGSYAPSVTYEGRTMGALDDLRALGQKLFLRWEKAAYALICGEADEDKDDREKLVSAFGLDAITVAAALSGLLVAHLGLAPALASVIAVILVKRFAPVAYGVFCEAWKEHLPQ